MSTADAIAAGGEVAADARAAGLRTTVTLAAAFGCPFDGEVPVARVRELAAAAPRRGRDEICLADTIGVGVPPRSRDLIAAVREVAPAPAARPLPQHPQHRVRQRVRGALDAG